MSTLVIYHSLYGETRPIAEALAQATDAATAAEEIERFVQAMRLH